MTATYDICLQSPDHLYNKHRPAIYYILSSDCPIHISDNTKTTNRKENTRRYLHQRPPSSRGISKIIYFIVTNWYTNLTTPDPECPILKPFCDLSANLRQHHKLHSKLMSCIHEKYATTAYSEDKHALFSLLWYHILVQL